MQYPPIKFSETTFIQDSHYSGNHYLYRWKKKKQNQDQKDENDQVELSTILEKEAQESRRKNSTLENFIGTLQEKVSITNILRCISNDQ